MLKIEVVTYQCKECSKPEIFNITGPLSATKHRLISKCFDSKVCMSCHIHNQIPKTADAILTFLTGKY